MLYKSLIEAIEMYFENLGIKNLALFYEIKYIARLIEY